jgi:hypothetical protein
MSDTLPLLLCDIAGRVLPARRKHWGEAMRVELAYMDDPRSAMRHAGGCVLAAVRERALDFDSRFAAGLWSVALASAAFAVFRLACAARGVGVLLGGHDDFREALVRGGADARTLAGYEGARPVVIAGFVALGLAHLVAAFLLFRVDLRRFLLAWAATLLIATLAVAIQLSIVWSLDGLPSEYFALLVQAVAVPLLLFWSNGRHLPRGERA